MPKGVFRKVSPEVQAELKRRYPNAVCRIHDLAHHCKLRNQQGEHVGLNDDGVLNYDIPLEMLTRDDILREWGPGKYSLSFITENRKQCGMRSFEILPKIEAKPEEPEMPAVQPPIHHAAPHPFGGLFPLGMKDPDGRISDSASLLGMVRALANEDTNRMLEIQREANLQAQRTTDKLVEILMGERATKRANETAQELAILQARIKELEAEEPEEETVPEPDVTAWDLIRNQLVGSLAQQVPHLAEKLPAIVDQALIKLAEVGKAAVMQPATLPNGKPS